MSDLFCRWPFLRLALAAMVGIAAGEALGLHSLALVALVVVLVVAALAMAARWRRRKWAHCLLLTALFAVWHAHHHYGRPARALAQIHREGPKVVHGSGVVASMPTMRGRSDGQLESHFLLSLTALRSTPSDVTGVKVLAQWTGRQPAIGDVLEFAGSLRESDSARNPGSFDFGAYHQREGIYSALLIPSQRDAAVTGQRPIALWKRGTLRLRTWMQKVLGAGIEDAPEVGAVIRSMVMGSKSEISDETRRHFEQTGTLHIFVVSGLHVGLLGVIAVWLLTAVGLSRRWAALVLLPLIWIYAALADFSPGSTRATAMGSVVLLGLICRRPPLTWNSYFAALFLILAWDTEQFFQPGFQFSFGVVAAILLLATRFQQLFGRFGQPDEFLPRELWRWHQRFQSVLVRWVGGLVAVSLAAWLGSLFFTAKYFHLVSPAALLANLLVVPMAALILAEAILALLSGVISLGLAAVFNNANWVLVNFLLNSVGFFAGIPGGHYYVAAPTWGERPALEIVTLDLGAGSSTVVWVEGEVWLMDCGSRSSYRSIVRPFLRTCGVNRLDGFIITHGDAQHVGGGSELLADFRPRRVMTGAAGDRSPTRRNFQQSLREHGLDLLEVRSGQTVALGEGGVWRVLSPVDNERQRLADDAGLVLQLRSGPHRVLFTSDTGFAVEQRLLHQSEVASAVLIKGMHRSDFSGTPAFMRSVGARYVIVADRIPFAEMPVTPLTEAAVTDTGGTLLRQSQTGAVRLRFYPDRIAGESFLPYHRFTSISE